jgi:hypothetical protein
MAEAAGREAGREAASGENTGMWDTGGARHQEGGDGGSSQPRARENGDWRKDWGTGGRTPVAGGG